MTEKNNDTREARSTRRRNRRRSRQRTPQSQPPTTTLVDATTSDKHAKTSGKTSGKKRRKATAGNRTRSAKPRTTETSMETRNETSAGGLVISGLSEAVAADGSVDLSRVYVALIGRLDRRGRLLWSMPKGHVETGEDITATAAREVWEETGIHGEVFAELGVIDYWFVSEGTRIHKTVHHHLLRYVDGELNDEDPEVTEVAWIPASGLIERFAYADERKLARIAHDLLPDLARDEQAAGRSTGDDADSTTVSFSGSPPSPQPPPPPYVAPVPSPLPAPTHSLIFPQTP